jgi:Flp pilus assembly protein TadD
MAFHQQLQELASFPPTYGQQNVSALPMPPQAVHPLSDALIESAEKGASLMASAQYAAAVSAFTTAINAAPHLWNLHNDRGQAYARSNKTNKALSDFTMAIGLSHSTEALPFVNRALMFDVLGRKAEARSDINKALEINPAHPQALRAFKVIAPQSGCCLIL